MKSKLRNAARTAGFSLIELMLIVAIIGVMASIAIPSFKGALVRAKRAERNLMFDAIYRSIEEYYNSNNYVFPTLSGTTTTLSGAYNPTYTAPFTSALKTFKSSAVGWSYLAFNPTGQMRYSYQFTANTDAASVSNNYFTIQSIGDADNNGIPALHTQTWTLTSTGNWTITFADSPTATEE